MADAADAETEAAAARIRRQARQLPAREPVFVREVCRKLDTDEWGVGSGNRVVMIQGGTGSGKSSQIPQILLDELGGPVLCTQPRRLAAASIAQRVAQERGCRLGSEVGYHIGAKRVAGDCTRLLFATCGITLEMLRTGGPAALKDFAFVVLDEVHERSSESDLVLACIHQYMKRELPDLRLVLMSATFDHERYKEYFADVGEGEAVPRIPVPQRPTLATSVLSHVIGRPAERYLSDVINRLEGVVSDGQYDTYARLLRKMCKQPMPDEIQQLRGGHVDTSAVHSLVCSLIFSLDESDAVVRRPDPSGRGEIISAERTTLVFLPTYRSLEELHMQLEVAQQRHGRSLKLSVLHSSVDLDECLRSITAQSGDRVHRVILASNVAESSLTIPGVSTVVDYCRANQIHWDLGRAVGNAKTVWASRSQCDQRCGRTGRTCQGTVYRLLPDRSVYERTLPMWEPPELTLSSLHEEMLLLASSHNRAMHNASTMLGSTLSPPQPEVIEASRRYLVNLGAIKLKTRRGGVTTEEATTYGRAIASLPLSLEGARLALRGMAEGQMRTFVLLGAIASTTPAPISKPFGNQAQWLENLRDYGGERLKVSDRAAGLMAQLAAYEWWQCKFVDAARLRQIGLRVSAGGAVVVLDAPAAEQTCSICTFPIVRTGGGGGGELEPPEPEPEPEEEEEEADESGRASSSSRAGAAAAVLPCGHAFHRSCIVPWITDQPTCPNCRADVPASCLAHGISSEPAGGGAAAMAPVEEMEAVWCAQHALVRTALRAVQETATAASTALQALDLDMLREKRNLQPEAWRSKGRLPAAAVAADGKPHEIHDLLSLMLSSSADRVEEKQMSKILKDVFKDSANKVMEQGQLPPPPGLDMFANMDDRRLCTYHFAGGCTRGSSCQFRHTLKPGEQRPICKFFGTPQGCRFGDSCRMPHGDANSPDTVIREAVASVAAENRLADQVSVGGGTAGTTAASSNRNTSYRSRLAGKQVVLLGEGDFSFAAAIEGTTSHLLATSLGTIEDVIAAYDTGGNDDTADRLAVLARKEAVNVIHGIDATVLHSVMPVLHKIIRTMTDVLCWMFPFTGVEGDNQGNAQLIKRWFSSVARVLHYEPDSDQPEQQQPGAKRFALPDVAHTDQFEVHVTLCGDQFSRWRVEASARDAFMTLCEIIPFNAAEFEGAYSPRRNNIDEPFALLKPLTYVFKFHPSPLLLPPLPGPAEPAARGTSWGW
jgi:HrpA-like RNA helicase